VAETADPPPDVITRLRALCMALPEAYEEQAWVGTRWMVRKRTFAHVLLLDSGWPPAYARAVGADGPMTLLALRSSGEELEALRTAGHPFYAPVWRSDEVLMALDEAVDWAEIRELITESYCRRAPASLSAKVDRPPSEHD
jgi:hypothetical protein